MTPESAPNPQAASGATVYREPDAQPAPPVREAAAQPALSAVLDSLVTKTPSAQQSGGEFMSRFLQAETGDALRMWINPQPGQKLVKDDVARRLNRDIARLDAVLSEQVNAIIHHPRFQQLEASWRGLKYLVEQASQEGYEQVKIKMLNASWKDLAKDVERAVEFDRTQLFRKVYEDEFGTPGGEPFGMLIGDYRMHHQVSAEHAIDDFEVLQSIAQTAAAAFAPFVTAPDPSFFGLNSFTEFELPMSDLSRTFDTLEYLKWKTFRESEDSRFVGMALPNVLMRKPYEDGDGTADGFRFREDVESPDRRKYLWGNAAYAFGEVAMRAFADCGWLADIRGFTRGQLGGGVVSGLPAHSFSTDATGIAVKCNTDGIIADAQEKELGELGFIPLCHSKDTEFAAFFGNQSVQKPKRYDTADATANARISAMLQYMLCVSRFAHYLKVMARENIGSSLEATDVEDKLHRWLAKYVTPNDDASVELKAEYPLREASVQVRDQPGKPGSYYCTIHLRPHFQLDDMAASVKLTTELAPPTRG